MWVKNIFSIFATVDTMKAKENEARRGSDEICRRTAFMSPRTQRRVLALLPALAVVVVLNGCVERQKHPLPDELKLQQIDSLRTVAQAAIPALDSAAQRATREYDAALRDVEAKRKALTVTPQELKHCVELRVRRDSARVKFDTQCARVRFLNKKRRAIEARMNEPKTYK